MTSDNFMENGFIGNSASILTGDDAPVDYHQKLYDLLEKIKPHALRNGWVVYSLDDKKIFTDKHEHITIEANVSDNQAILASILFAKEKFHDYFEITGSPEFQKKVMEIMIENKLTAKFSNPHQALIFQRMGKESPINHSENGFVMSSIIATPITASHTPTSAKVTKNKL